jgi:vacuolar-type H+-ATPase subunit H
MQDVVRIVLEAEAEAKDIVQHAEAEAERLTAEARIQAQEIVQNRRHETAKQADAMVKAAEQEANQERQSRLDHAAAQIESTVHLTPATARALADAVVRCVCGTP